ncbi:MAG: hydroxymethylglutaryl-CoA lyase [Steroidobacteraceae bacterium]|nr:hydroxymethylglutaryl-CoA lyase [Steroidobacteraceae bacterium]
MTLPRSIGLVEVGPRDGLQNESATVPVPVKVEFIRRAAAAGLRRIEVASFVSPRRVPQMADAEDVMRALPRQAGLRYIGLVLNRAGFDRAAAAGCEEIGMVVFTTDAFNERNQGTTTDGAIRAWHEIAAAARTAGIKAQVTISAAFGCPFEGEVAPERVVGIAQQVAEAGPFEIAVADTIGVAVPGQVSEVFGRVAEALPGMALRGHFHNTRNTGLANAYAALLAGAGTLDASLGGLGGCPFAPAATGNIPTEDLVYMLGRMGIGTGVDLGRAIEAARYIEQQVGHPVPGMLLKAGPFPGAARPAAAKSA